MNHSDKTLSGRRFHSSGPPSMVFATKSPSVSDNAQLLRDAHQLLVQKKYPKAEVLLAVAQAENPRDPLAAAYTIRLYCETGSMGLAKGQYERAKKYGYANKAVYSSMISQYAREGMVVQGLAALTDSISRNFDTPAAYCSMIEMFGKMRLPNEAREVFTLAQSRRAHTDKVYSAMIMACLTFRMPERARELFKETVEDRIVQPALFRPMVRSFALMGRISQALELLQTAHEMKVCDAHLCKSLLQAGIQCQKLKQAEQVFSFAFKEGYCDGTMYGMMLAAYAGQPRNARKIFDLADSKGYASAELYSQMIDIHANNSEGVQAAELFIRGLGYGYVSHTAFEGVSTALYSEGRFKDILKLIDSLPEAFSSNHYALIRKAEVLRKLKRYDEAIEHIKKVIDQNHLSQSRKNLANIILAFSLKDSGRLAEAREAFKCLMMVVNPADFRFARVACGLVFVWENSGFPRDYLNERKNAFLLERLRGFQKKSRGNLYVDVQKAIRVLEKRMGLATR